MVFLVNLELISRYIAGINELDVIYTMDRLTAKTKIFLKIAESNAAIIINNATASHSASCLYRILHHTMTNDIMYQRYAG